MPGPHVCNPSGIFFLVSEMVRGGGVVVATRRVTEREKERKGEKDYHGTNAAAS